MDKTVERLEADWEGACFEFPVFRFRGDGSDAPSAYLQAALHADELPGVVAIDALMPKLLAAEKEGRIRGSITIVPWANPLGRGQYLFGDHQGRFHVGTRTNFNREFPLLEAPQKEALAAYAAKTADRRLKRRLLELSLGHDIVLDLHCDDEGVPYFYVPKLLWPAMADCASALGLEAVVFWETETDGTFEGASINPYRAAEPAVARLDRRVVATVEYRGQRDVGYDTAKADGEGLYRLLAARGVIVDAALPKPAPFAGVAAPIENIEMIAAPRPGAILFDVEPGARVQAGARLATIVHRPGEPDGRTEVFAPQSGYVLTRRRVRLVRRGDDLIKLVGDGPAGKPRTGALEA